MKRGTQKLPVLCFTFLYSSSSSSSVIIHPQATNYIKIKYKNKPYDLTPLPVESTTSEKEFIDCVEEKINFDVFTSIGHYPCITAAKIKKIGRVLKSADTKMS